MRKIIYLSSIFMFSVSLVNAANNIEEKLNYNENNLKIESFVEKAEEVFFGYYTGRCLDGHEFRFYAENRDEAQAYVNGYCAGRAQANVPETAP